MHLIAEKIIVVMLRSLIYRFKLTQDTFTPLIVAPYVIKRNIHPKRGNLIDVYIPYPNPFLLDRYKKDIGLGKDFTLVNLSVKSIVREYRIPYRPLVARHWPKNINEDRMLILLKYPVSDREVFFRGQRNNPPGNFKIIETGLFYVLDIYVQNLFFVFLVGFQRKVGLSFAKGSTYIWFPDLERVSGMSAFDYRTMFGIHLFLRNLRVLHRLPKIEYKHRQDNWSEFTRLFWYRNVRPLL